MRYCTIIILFILCSPIFILGQDTLHVGDNFSRLDQIKNQNRTYIHYRELKDGRKIPSSIKEISVSEVGNNIRIVQTEYSGSDTKSLITVVEKNTLKTISHKRTSSAKNEAFQFTDVEILGVPNDTSSSNQDFRIPLTTPTFNFEIDFIILESIDWESKNNLILNLYHPGGKTPPNYYTFVKEGEETLTTGEGDSIDTWRISTDYNGQPPATFWISKKTGLIVKNETDAMKFAGFKFVKQLMSLDS